MTDIVAIIDLRELHKHGMQACGIWGYQID